MAKTVPLPRVLAEKTSLYFSRNTGEIFMRGRKLVIIAAPDQELEYSLERIRRVVLVGRVKLELPLLHTLLRNGVPVDFLDVFGRPIGQLLSLEQREELCPCDQWGFQTSASALELARQVILAKLDNCREVIRRRVDSQIPWTERRKAIVEARDPSSLRGAEGVAAKLYFSCWSDLLRQFEWRGRHPHPPPDPVNLLLSMGYGLLHNRLSSSLHSAGLNPRVGFFHMSRGRHCALASDLMEPLRALVDTSILNLVRRSEIHPEDFRMRGKRCVCAERRIFGRLLDSFEAMFHREHNFYPSASDPRHVMKCSVNESLDWLAESFLRHILEGSECFLPRLAPCPAT